MPLGCDAHGVIGTDKNQSSSFGSAKSSQTVMDKTVNWVVTTPFQYEQHEENVQIYPLRTSLRTPSPPRTPEPLNNPVRKKPGPKPLSYPPPPSSPKRLTDEDRIHIFRLSIQHSDAYGRDTDKAFFQKIACLFEEATGKKHQTLNRAVNDMVKARRKHLAQLHDSGEEDPVSSYSQTIDEWITVVDERKALEQGCKEAQGLKDQETKASLDWRENSLRLFSQKNQYNKRKRQQSIVAELHFDDDYEDEDAFRDKDGNDSFTDSITISESLATPSISGSTHSRRKRWKSKTPNPNSPNVEVDFHRFVDAYEKRSSNLQVTTNTQLEEKVDRLESDIGVLKKGISDILSLLKKE